MPRVLFLASSASTHIGRWVKAIVAHGYEVHLLSLDPVRVLANPLRDASNHRLQIATKVMDYLGYGRPILATDLPDIRGVIEDCGAGVLVPYTVEGLAKGIVDRSSAGLDELNQMGANALQPVREKHAWRLRVQRIVNLLTAMRQTDASEVL